MIATVDITPLLQPQHLSAQVQVLRQRLRWAHVRHLPTFERDRAIGERKRQIEVVIDDQDRDLASKLVERLEQLLDHGRSKTLERLVANTNPPASNANGLAFSPDEKKLYVIDTGFTDGPDNPSHIRVFDVDFSTPPIRPTQRSS